MNKLKGFLLIASAFVLSLFNIGAYADGFQYMQLLSVVAQPASAPTNMIAYESVDGVLKLGEQKKRVTVNADGVFFVMVSAQIGAVKADEKLSGYVDLWLNQNDIPVKGTNSRLTVVDSATGVLVSQYLLKVKAGDTISVGFSSNNPGLGLVSIPTPAGESAISASNFSIYKLS